jgi:hypothetical protein
MLPQLFIAKHALEWVIKENNQYAELVIFLKQPPSYAIFGASGPAGPL